MTHYYAGIGSRETPKELEEDCKAIAVALGEAGLTLRSGGAIGADTYFEDGAEGFPMEIYLHKGDGEFSLDNMDDDIVKEAEAIARRFHKRHHTWSTNTKKLMTRNTFQVLGKDLKTPSKFIVCWTEDGKASGGTGQAMRIAKHYNIPIFNLKNETDVLNLRDLIKNLKEKDSC